MNSELFRFSTIRSPQGVKPQISYNNTIDLSARLNPFYDSIKYARSRNSMGDVMKLVSGFVSSDNFIDTRSKLDSRFSEFYFFILNNLQTISEEEIKAEFLRIFQTTPQKLLLSDVYNNFINNVNSSLICSMIESTSPIKRSFIAYLIYINECIERMSKGRKLDIQNIFNYKILIPNGIFPLPLLNQSLLEDRKKAKEANDKLQKEVQRRRLGLAKELDVIDSTLNDLLTVYQKGDFLIDNSSINLRSETNPISATAGFSISIAAFNSLALESRNLLEKIGVKSGNADISRAINLLERKAEGLSKKIYRNVNAGSNMIRIGNTLIPDIALHPDSLIDTGTLVADGVHPVGPCPPIEIETLNTGNTTITLPKGHGEARILGIADLMLVEQELLRYELGEIAHIENVLKSEVRERKLKTSKTRDETVFTEIEETDEKQKDLATTDRYELQTETQKVINENSSKDAGITVNASYGPSVDVTAAANYASSSSVQDSQTASSNFARETTSRATSRLEKRKLERRTVRTIEKIIEINRHLFENNQTDAENITGIYRWADKIYKAQIVNYGKRLMLEFIVPEPAAFLRYAMTKQPSEEIMLVRPEAPGYCINNSFVPLNPTDLTRYNYMMWVSKYAVEDIVTPPLQSIVVSHASSSSMKDNESVGDNKIGNTTFSIDIPDGYYPSTATVMHDAIGYKKTQDRYWVLSGDTIVETEVPHVTVLIDNKAIGAGQRHDFPFTSGNWKNISVAVTLLNESVYALVVNVFCILNREKFEEWQLQTYNAIMNAYNDKKSRYDNAIETAKIRAGYSQIEGKNPFMNRECEKTELKRGCISLLTGQRFEYFDAMSRNISPYGYPEIDFNEAKAEGPYIQFFENAIEWNNMSYIFYPYFWGKKDDWLTVSRIDDADPLYTRFLQAGAARVQVPMRLGFEKAMMHYLSFGEIWNGEGILVNTIDGDPDPLHISVIEELKGQMGNQNIAGIGTINVTQGSDLIHGTDTVFSSDVINSDENRRIVIGGITYVIKKVISTTEIILKTRYTGNSETDLHYEFGAKLVGDPWEVKLPTDLVKIDESIIII